MSLKESKAIIVRQGTYDNMCLTFGNKHSYTDIWPRRLECGNISYSKFEPKLLAPGAKRVRRSKFLNTGWDEVDKLIRYDT